MFRVIIIEDEFSPRQVLREKLTLHFPDIEIVGECKNAETALIEILRLRPDLLFLDIEMPGQNGLWLADELMRMKTDAFLPPDIIFTTGYTYSKYLLKAIELAALDYIVKPVGVSRLEKAMTRFRERAGKTTGLQNLADAMNDKILLNFKSYNGVFFFRPDDIVYVEADGNYACMFFSGGVKEDVFERLGEIEKKLPSEIFLRAGRSVIFNRKYLYKITDTAIQLHTPSSNYTVEISRPASKQLKEILL